MRSPDAVALWVTSSGKPSRRRLSWPGWSKRLWSQRLFGAVTLLDSTAARGVDSWIFSLAATPANLSASPASAVGSVIRDTYGPIALASLKNRNPASVSSRTSADTLGSALTLFGMTFDGWAIELRRDCLRRRKLARRTREKGCLSSQWPTPTAVQGENPRTPEQLAACDQNHRPSNLKDSASHWSTPRTITGGGESGERKKELGRTDAGGGDLQAQVTSWPTPNANPEAPNCSKTREGGRIANRETDQCLARVATQAWPTPKSRDTKGQSQRGQHGLKDALPNMAESFPPDQATAPDGHVCSPKCRRLNPRFVEMLMGFPPGWTDCGPSETPWSHFKRRMRSALFGLLSMEATKCRD